MADFTDDTGVTITLDVLTQDDPGVVDLDFAAGAGDVDAPLVSFGLLSGTQIQKDTPIPVTVTEETALEALIIMVFFAASGAYEVAYDGSDFAPGYADSTIAPVVDGNLFTLRRNNGWFVTPSIRVVAVDTSGNGGIPA